jgi:hypothetical protein
MKNSRKPVIPVLLRRVRSRPAQAKKQRKLMRPISTGKRKKHSV